MPLRCRRGPNACFLCGGTGSIVDENGDAVEDELEYTRTENVEESARLWGELTSGNVPNEDIEHHVRRLADLTETFILQE